jgi:hypothetical protein
MWTFPRTLALTAVLLLGGPLPLRAQPSEYLAEIVLIDKMTRFVEWPKADPGRAFILAVIGRTPFGEALDDYFSHHPLKNRPVTIRYLHKVEDLDEADLLFICASERPRLAQILGRVKGRPTLTVADSEGFAASGTMVGFVSVGGKIRFEINPVPIRESGIRIRPDFLQLAKIVP